MEYIFKFLVQSRKLYCRASGDQEEQADFKEMLMSFITACGLMLKYNQDPVVKSQVSHNLITDAHIIRAPHRINYCKNK
jgi:hypothetical protein